MKGEGQKRGVFRSEGQNTHIQVGVKEQVSRVGKKNRRKEEKCHVRISRGEAEAVISYASAVAHQHPYCSEIRTLLS